MQILKGMKGYGIDINDDADAVGLVSLAACCLLLAACCLQLPASGAN